LAAVAFFVYALVLLFVPDNSLSNVLQPYDGFAADSEFDDEGSSAIAKSALLQRAVELTEQVAESQGYLSRAEASLERANLPLRAGEALFFYVALVLVATLIALLLTKSLIGGIVILVIAALVPPAIINFLASRRRRAFMYQLPDTLQLLSGTLRAGYSLMQGVEAVSQEVDDPMGIELRRVVTEARLGRPLEESLDSAAERMNSPDFAWAVMAIRIQREVGGNLAELLLTVAETMTARERLRRDVRTLTAEGRMSAIVLGILPIGLGAVMFVINPEYMSQLYKTGLGITLLIAAGVSMGIGFFWMKKIINIEI
jgi:tight adherence protein B